MNQLDIKKVASAVTEEPTELIITREPKDWIDKLLVHLKIRSLKKSFLIKPPSLGMAYKITGLFMDVSIPKREGDDINDWSNSLILSNSRVMAEIIATYVQGTKETAPDSLIDYFMDNMTFNEMDQITALIKSYIDIIPFINSISSIRSLDLISPGLMEESLQNTGEIIAPGALSEAQQSTSALV